MSVIRRAVPSSGARPTKRHERLACQGVVDRHHGDPEEQKLSQPNPHPILGLASREAHW